MTTELSQMKAVKMLIQLQFGGEKLKNNLATVLAFCSAKKKGKCFIAIIRDLLKKVLDANYLTNCRRARECSDLLFVKMSSPHLEIKTGFFFFPLFKKPAVM